MQKKRLVLLGTVAAVAYGVVHDQITARLCLEYFSLAHPPFFPVRSPALLALCWGVASTFFLGLIAGFLLAEISQSSDLPPVPFSRLCRGVGWLLTAMAAGAALAGVLGFTLAQHGLVTPPGSLNEIIAPTRHARFVAVWFAHMASYAVGFVGLAIWLLSLWRQRGCPQLFLALPRSGPALLRVVVLLALLLLAGYVRFLRR